MEPLTCCNPLPIPDIPPGRWLDTDLTSADPADFDDYRSVSGPFRYVLEYAPDPELRCWKTLIDASENT